MGVGNWGVRGCRLHFELSGIAVEGGPSELALSKRSAPKGLR